MEKSTQQKIKIQVTGPEVIKVRKMAKIRNRYNQAPRLIHVPMGK